MSAAARGTFPALAGRPGIVQGRYGVRGNVELVAPDPVDGLWVFWHNTDPAGTEPAGAGVAPGQWSAGLRFATGRAWSAVRIVQSVHGPGHLELLARRGPVIERFRWSPEAAFTAEGSLAEDATGTPALAETPDGTLHAAIPTRSGVAVLRAAARAYPRLTWTRQDLPAPATVHACTVAPSGPTAIDLVLLGPAGAAFVEDATGDRTPAPLPAPPDARDAALVTIAGTRHLILARGPEGLHHLTRGPASPAWSPVRPPHPYPAEAVAACPTHLDGRARLDVVTRRGTTVHHAVTDP